MENDSNIVVIELYLFQNKERENIDKIHKRKEDGRRKQIRVQESITYGEGIIPPHVRCTQQEPFI